MSNAETLGEVKKKEWKDVSVVRTGDKIILPEEMDYDEGIKWLQRKKTEDEREVSINEQVDAFPLDGAFNFWKAISLKYGFAGLVPTPTFWGPRPPQMIGVATSPTESVQVPWGRLEIPSISGHLQTMVGQKDGRQIFVIGGVVRQKHKAEIAELARRTRELVRNESIYRGKAIKVTFPELDPENFDPTAHAPKFIDTTKVNEKSLIFSKSLMHNIQVNLFNLIEKTDICRAFGESLKRGILFEGRYGTGKTLTANVTAKKCVDNRWTFIYLHSVKELQRAIFFAQQYGPAVIFAEDIDQVLKGNRDEEMNGILNTIDGVDTKGHDIIVVLTTNHVELINKAMLRPGRLDAVIPVLPPDAEAVGRMIRMYAAGLVSENEDLSEVGKILDGHVPAVIHETVKRAKLAAISHINSVNEPMKLLGSDFSAAARALMPQIELIEPNKNPPPHPMQILGQSIGREIAFGQVASTMDVAELVKHLPAEVIEAAKVPLAANNGAPKKS